jgi:hypothetical protein
MSLWDKLGDEKLIKLNKEKRQRMSEKMKGYSPSGQRHEFNRKFHDTGKSNQFGYKEKFK